MKPFSVALLGLFIGSCLLLNSTVTFILLAIIAYIWLLLKYPEIALFLTILVIFNCFSMMNEDTLRLPFLFRLRDVMLLSIWIPFLLGCCKRDEIINSIFQSPVAKAIVFIFFIVALQLFLTKIRFPQESLNSMIRMGRRYLYYGLFFPAMYILYNPIKRERFIVLSVSAVSLFSILFIIQFFVGDHFMFFPYGRLSLQILSGAGVNRLYVSGVVSVTLLFDICLMLVVFVRGKSKYLLAGVLLFGLQTILLFGRAHNFGVVTGVLFAFFVAKEHNKLKKIFIFGLVSIFFAGILAVGVSSIFPEKRNPIEIMMTRTFSTFDAVINRDDTFGARLEDSAGRLDLIRQYPIFGVGFLHDDANLFSFNKGTIARSFRTGDSGVLSLMMDFGFFGVFILLILSFLLFKRILHVYNVLSNPSLRAVVLGVTAFYFGRLFSFITLADFVVYDGIVVVCLSLVILELIALKGEFGGLINNHC